MYEGEFRDGQRHGKGKYVHQNGDIFYEGEYQNDVINGKGRMTMFNGDVYEGDFLDGKRHGSGKYKVTDAKECYTGEFDNDMKHGQGKYECSNGDYYEGRVAERCAMWSWKVLAQGKYEAKELGETYQGTWNENKPDGMFTLTSCYDAENGEKKRITFNAEFQNNLLIVNDKF
ncbi:unnamed protein product [Sphagnum tenellum]